MATIQNLNNLVINNIESREVFDYMVGNGLINENEFYIVQDDMPVGFRQTTISIPSANWVEQTADTLYSQVVQVNTATANTKVDLQPTAEQIVALQAAENTFMAENDGTGVITIWSIGPKPASDYSMQAYLTEVTVV